MPHSLLKFLHWPDRLIIMDNPINWFFILCLIATDWEFSGLGVGLRDHVGLVGVGMELFHVVS